MTIGKQKNWVLIFYNFRMWRQVSWLRHTSPIPQLMALNNMSNSLDSRVKAIVGEEWSEFVLMIRE